MILPMLSLAIRATIIYQFAFCTLLITFFFTNPAISIIILWKECDKFNI